MEKMTNQQIYFSNNSIDSLFVIYCNFFLGFPPKLFFSHYTNYIFYFLLKNWEGRERGERGGEEASGTH